MSDEEMFEDEELGEEEDLPPELSGDVDQLNEEMVAENLSLLSRIGDGLAHAYIKLDLREKEITDASILNKFIHIRFADLSRNNLKDISCLGAMTHLMTLRVDNNLLTSAKLEELPYIQFASFSKNKIQTAEGLSHPMLEHLCLSFNEISIV